MDRDATKPATLIPVTAVATPIPNTLTSSKFIAVIDVDDAPDDADMEADEPEADEEDMFEDEGNENNTTDWFSLCKVDELPDGSTISLFIDTSGSMTLNTVRASYDLFIAKCNEKNITIASVVENNNEDWITPFL